MAPLKFSMAFVVRNFVYNTPAMPKRWSVSVSARPSRTDTPPRVPTGRPGTCSSCVVSGGMLMTSLSSDVWVLPTASRLTFLAAEMYQLRRRREAPGKITDRDVVEAVTAFVGGGQSVVASMSTARRSRTAF